jgi:hypothetical protein
MFLKRQIPIAIVAFVGVFTLFGWFAEQPFVEGFVNDDATQWFDILASFAVFLGALNLMKLQLQKIARRRRGWPYSLFAIAGFVFAMTAGFVMRGAYTVEVTDAGADPGSVARVMAAEAHMDETLAATELADINADTSFSFPSPHFTERGARTAVAALTEKGASARVVPAAWGTHWSTKGSLFNWMFDNVFTPLSATMFALLAFFVASASYRAFRIRNFEATLLLVAGIIIMLGRVPVGSFISSWFVMYILVLVVGIGVNSWLGNRMATFATVAIGLAGVTIGGFATGWPVDKPSIFFLPLLQDWIYNFPNVAGARAIMIGIGLGIIATSMRYILGIEKSYMGE